MNNPSPELPFDFRRDDKRTYTHKDRASVSRIKALALYADIQAIQSEDVDELFEQPENDCE